MKPDSVPCEGRGAATNSPLEWALNPVEQGFAPIAMALNGTRRFPETPYTLSNVDLTLQGVDEANDKNKDVRTSHRSGRRSRCHTQRIWTQTPP